MEIENIVDLKHDCLLDVKGRANVYAELGFGRKNLPPVSVVGSEPRPIGIGRSVDFFRNLPIGRFGIGRLKNSIII